MEQPKRQEIDQRTIKLMVGIVALSLPGLTSLFAPTPITSISASYYVGGWSQTIFLGFLFAIAAFLVAYNGESSREMLLSKAAAVAALGVALFPCRCGNHPVLVPYVHGVSAAVMFLILAYFCHLFRLRARRKGYPQARVRAAIYTLCGATILFAIAGLAADRLILGGALSQRIPRWVFYGEAIGLVAFGVSWLTASRTLPVLTRSDERFSPLRATNPG